MSYVITVSGRRASDGGAFKLRLVVDDSSERAVLEAVEEFDWTDAATRLVRVEAAESTQNLTSAKCNRVFANERQ